MSITDRIAGLNEGVAIKAPVVVATTANITLSGEQTIDGVAVVSGDRVLVKNQNTGSENGIYTASTGAWSRALDFDGARDVVQGTMVLVQGGSTNGNQIFTLTTASPTIGTSSLSFSVVLSVTNAPVVIETSSSSAALRVTQTGSGEALRVEDSANPDSTAFVVDAAGAITTGSTINKITLTAPATSATITPTDGTTTTLSGGTVREALTAARTYYVRTDGSDSNTGLANTAGGAFLTLQKAWNTIVDTLDMKGYTVTIQVADGTYTSGITTSTAALVSGRVVINGNSGTPANVIISTTSASAFTFIGPCYVTLQNFEIRTTTSGSSVIVQSGALVNIGTGMRFGACATIQIYSGDNGNVYITGAYTITGGAVYHYLAERGGIIASSSITVTSSGTFSYSGAFVLANTNGTVNLPSMTYTGGTVTGTRYSATLNGVINTNGGGANYFPGNSAGSTATGGQYA